MRFWGTMYYKVVPPCLVVSVDLLAEQPLWSLDVLGDAEVHLLEFAVPLLCASLIFAGTRLQLRWFTYYGLLHLAVFLMRATHRHFQEYLGWPVIVISTGAIAITVGLVLENLRMRRQVARKPV